MPSPLDCDETDLSNILHQKDILDISSTLQDGGKLLWDAPGGEWTIVRMGIRVTGAGTRPAPEPALGLESNKMDTSDFARHLSNYTDILLEKTSPRKEGVGWTGFHMDSWESGSQNWTEGIVEAFKNRRGYDPEPYFLAYTGRAIESVEITERFLWDMRKTIADLISERFYGGMRERANALGIKYSAQSMKPFIDNLHALFNHLLN